MTEPTNASIRIPSKMSDAAQASIATAPERFTAPTPHAEDEPEPSWRLRLVTGYYSFWTVMASAGCAVVLAGLLFDLFEARADARANPIELVGYPLALASAWFTRRMLKERRRMGAIVAAIPVVVSIFRHLSASDLTNQLLNIIPAMLGLLLIASIWKELE